MSSFPSLEDNYRSFSSGLYNNSEDGVQKALKETIVHMMHQELKPYFESLVRNIVKVELRNLLTELDRNSEDRVDSCEPRCLRLQFLKNVCLPILTNEEIQEGHTSIEVALIDNLSEKVVDSGPEASAKVEIVALKGDIGGPEGDDWTSEEFNRRIVREREEAYNKEKKKRKREGKRPLLDGDIHLHLNKGIGVVGKIKFRQYTRWMKSREFKLGAQVLDSFSGVRIKEAVTKPFIVKDRRIKCERKGGSPCLSDDVSKLKNIRKDGKHRKRLQQHNINTVEDFLIQLFKDPERLEHILGLEADLWEVTVNHARTCAIDKPIYYYYSSQQKIGVVFKVIEGVLGLISGCKYFTTEELSEKDKADARLLAFTAFNHWQDVLRFINEDSLLQYVNNLQVTTDISIPPKLQIPCGNNTSFQGFSSSIDSSTPRNDSEDVGLSSAGHVENSEEQNSSLLGVDLYCHNSSSRDPIIDFVENYFRRQKAQAQKSWKKLSVVVRFSMTKSHP